MKTTHTQEKEVLNHLMNKGGLTTLDAIRLYDCTRLGARIFDLKKAGIGIVTDIVKRGDRHVAFYSLSKNQPVK